MSLENKKVIGVCPCGCGREYYSLGNYRGFEITLNPFGGSDSKSWVIYAKLEKKTLLDKELLKDVEMMDEKMWSDTAHSRYKGWEDKAKIADVFHFVKSLVDKYLERKNKIIKEILANNRMKKEDLLRIVLIVSEIKQFGANVIGRTVRSVELLQDLCKNEFGHDPVRLFNSAICDICKLDLGWYCEKSPTKACEYEEKNHYEYCKHCGNPQERK